MSEALRKELLDRAITMLKVGGPEYDSRDVLEVLEQLQAALAEPEQEPVAWLMPDGAVLPHTDEWYTKATPLFTHPPRREPLTPWIKTSDQYPPEGVRVFWFNPDTNQVGYDTWMGGDYKFNVEYWMHIPGITGEKT